MAVIPIYHQGELANPTVGVPQMNQSGEIAGQAALEGQQGIAEAQLGQNRQDIVEANSGMDAGVRAFGGVYKDIQWVQAQLRGQQNAAEKHSQDIQDAIQSNALGNQMKADLSDKMLALKMAGKDNPDALPGQWDDGLEGYVDKFAESHPMNDAVRGNLEKDFANIKAAGHVALNENKFTQGKENAQNIVTYTDQYLADKAGKLFSGNMSNDLSILKGYVDISKNAEPGRQLAFGEAKAQLLGKQNENDIVYNYVDAATKNFPEQTAQILQVPFVKDALTEDQIDKFNKASQNGITAINNAKMFQLRAERNVREMQAEDTYSSAKVQDDKGNYDYGLMASTVQKFNDDIKTLVKQGTDNVSLMPLLKDLNTKKDALQSIIDSHNAELRADAKAESVEERRAAADAKKEQAQKIRDDKTANIAYRATPEAIAGKAAAEKAYADLPKAADILGWFKFVHGTAQEQDAIERAKGAWTSAYHDGQLGYVGDKETVKLYQDHMAHIQEIANASQQAKKDPNFFHGDQWTQTLGRIRWWEHHNAPAPQTVHTVTNPAGDAEKTRKINEDWAKQFPQEITKYNMANKLPPDYKPNAREMEKIKNGLTVKTIMGKTSHG